VLLSTIIVVYSKSRASASKAHTTLVLFTHELLELEGFSFCFVLVVLVVKIAISPA
jgi:hypothetical protein